MRELNGDYPSKVPQERGLQGTDIIRICEEIDEDEDEANKGSEMYGGLELIWES